jgi:hypothetical protein
MRSWIEPLCSAPDFQTLVDRWPRAVRTPHGIVIPRIHRISERTTIAAEVHPGHRVVLRPFMEGRGSFESARHHVIGVIERIVGVSLRPEPVDSPLGPIALSEEWGDFAVIIRTDGLQHSRPVGWRDNTKSFSAPS